jgi:putative nucleotidyltransferase with HDIG domain
VLGTGRNAIPVMLARLCDPMARVQDVAHVIAQEPGLAARVLRVANSAYYGMSGKVATLERAFVLLGVDAVRGIAAAVCLDRSAIRAIEAAPIDMSAILRHSVATAAAAEALARISHRQLAAEAFIAGLLHDFGVTVQLQLDRDGCVRLVDALSASASADEDSLEQQLVAVGHARCGAVVFESWKLPTNLVEAVRHHHEPAAAPAAARPLATLVHLGNHLSISIGHAFAFEPSVGAVREDYLKSLGLSLENLEQVMSTLPDRVHVLQQMFSENGDAAN